jgi:ribose 5-phosphate isomerase B
LHKEIIMDNRNPTLSVAMGADHAGYEYKDILRRHLESKGLSVLNFGTDGPDSVDYPDYAHPVAESVESGKANIGVLICGSANGVAITANKHAGIRAAICWDLPLASLARQHNDANVLCIPARFVDVETAKAMLDVFLNTSFEGGRHASRVAKISCT